ncbi:MAG: FAD-binding domain-containing protein [Pseudomonadota bacterium]
MTEASSFPPHRTAALERLSDFVPRAGRAYAAGRNTDAGPGQHKAVSGLSPYIRCRLVTETEVLQAVLGRHSATAAEKFVQEVFWRTYWKGWLELRPGIWAAYLAEGARDWDAVQTQTGLRARWEAACLGETSIDCFDSWAKELTATGYLHNHARMWFASIWIFTLQLPWALGADFFLRHLLDGDPASNTLGWRWVAGLQTHGKTYLARPDNITRFTNGRFVPSKGQLASQALPLDRPPPPAPRALPGPADLPTTGRTGLLLHAEDLAPEFLLAQCTPDHAACLTAMPPSGPLTTAPQVDDFRKAAVRDAAARWSERLGGAPVEVESADAVLEWAKREKLDRIATPYAPVGAVAATLSAVAALPGAPPIIPVMRTYDRMAWPHATKGFFPFKAKIPSFLDQLGLC